MKEHVLNHKEPLSSQQPKKVVFIEMFRAGPQISSTGQKLVFTESDLDQVVGSYNPDTHEAPLIIGHDQQDDTPALGWVRKIWKKGQELWGKVELTPKAEQLIKDGVFKKVSSSFYLPEAETNPTPGKLSLRHLGLVSIPAVKGLTAFSELSEQETITITPSEGESSISFKEHLGKNQTMARKKTKPETPTSVASVVEHNEGGGMTVNINIGGGDKPKANVYDDSGNRISETGAPAEYDMDYGMESDSEDDASAMDPGDGASDSLGLEDGADEGADADPTADGDMPSQDGEAPDAEAGMDSGDDATDGGTDDGSAGPSTDGDTGSGMETEDISGDMQGDDQKIAQLASNYEIDELIKALALKTDAASMMEGEGMSYGEMPEGLKKAMEAKKGGESESEKDDEEEEDSKDMGEAVKEGEKPSDAGQPPSEDVKGADEPKGEQVYSEEEATEEDEEVSEHGEGCKDYEEDEEEKKKKEMMKGDMSEETVSKEATGTLDHSETAMGVRGQNDLQARVAELEEELARQKKLMREKEISDFCETLYDGGKLTQQIVSKTDLVRFMETLNNKNSVNFSETGKASQFDFFKGVLENLPSMVSFEEFATPASAPPAKKQVTPSADGYVYDPATADLHAQALEYSEAKGVEYTIALKAVLSNS
jgi:hypothetical protein